MSLHFEVTRTSLNDLVYVIQHKGIRSSAIKMKQIRQVLTQKIYQANRQMGYYHGDSHDWSDRMESDG